MILHDRKGVYWDEDNLEHWAAFGAVESWNKKDVPGVFGAAELGQDGGVGRKQKTGDTLRKSAHQNQREKQPAKPSFFFIPQG